MKNIYIRLCVYKYYNMCGISGLLSTKKHNNNFQIIKQSLTMLLNRGYDSCGCAGVAYTNNTIINNKFANSPNISSIDQLAKTSSEYNECSVLIAHNRWATHGETNNINAHPHIDYTGNIALVHNGIIENYQEIRDMLESNGVEFKSSTDSESIVNLIGYHYSQNTNMPESINKAIGMLKGSWALCIICKNEPDTLYCIRNLSPLLIGFGDNFCMGVSEKLGFDLRINNFITLANNDLVTLRVDGSNINFTSSNKYEKKILDKSNDSSASPEPYPHWTLKEIMEQSGSSFQTIVNRIKLESNGNYKINLEELDKLIESPNLSFINIESPVHLILLGCGTSYHAGLASTYYFKELTNFSTVQVFDAGEFSLQDLPKHGRCILVLLSQSGETKDVARCIELAKQAKLLTIGVVNVVDSLIAREVDACCYIRVGREIGVASTKAFTSQVLTLFLISGWFAQLVNSGPNKLNNYIKDLLLLPSTITKLLENQAMIQAVQDIGSYLVDKTSCFVLGKGPMESFGKEGSLKIKEIGYIHSEGYSTIALKHGPFSLLEPSVPVIIINPNDSSHSKVLSTIEEVHSRKSPIILITDTEPDIQLSKKIFKIIRVPANYSFRGILHNIPLQLIAYYLSIGKSINPDMPRNLAKCVTVD